MNVFEEIETAIQDFEELLGVSVTIIDRDGVLHSQKGYPLFSRQRQSHRKNKICDVGFCARCVENCRHEMNAEGERLGRYFIGECWKGAKEVVVPIIGGGTHLGSFFVGIWRDSEISDISGSSTFSDEMVSSYNALQEFDVQCAHRIGRMATVFVNGMLDKINLMKPLELFSDGYRARISRFIHRNASSAPRLPDLASELSLSPSRASHLVKELFDSSFTDLLWEERMRRARTLLLSTDDSVSEIADRIGVSDEYHFNKVFKRREGVPPGRFRKAEEYHQNHYVKKGGLP